MRRIAIVGPGGAGKSTLARRLGERLGLPVVHLDAEHWRPGWVETPAEEWAEKVRALARGERWIIDGNYGGTMEIRFAAADTIVFLDFPRRICLWRVLRRQLMYRGRSRPDMTEGAPSASPPSSSAGSGSTRAPGARACWPACAPPAPTPATSSSAPRARSKPSSPPWPVELPFHAETQRKRENAEDSRERSAFSRFLRVSA